MSLPTLPIDRIVKFINPLMKSPFFINQATGKVKLEKVCRMSRRKRQGTAAVEFALVAPVFFLLVFGMIEFGRMVMVQQVVTSAAREGARYAAGLSGSITTQDVVTSISNNTNVISTIKKYLAKANITTTVQPTVVAAADTTTSTTTYFVTVTVSVPFSEVSWLPTPLWLGSTTLTSTSVMRLETVQQ